LRKVFVAFNELPKIKINYPAANSWVLEWGSNTFAPRGGELNPKRLLKNRRVDKQSASTLSAENNLKPTAVLRNPDTNSGGCIVSTNTTCCTTFSIT